MMNILEISHLNKNYAKFCLDNVSFCIEQGSIMGFIGRNGAGKTTTLKSILNLVHSCGSVKYFGLELAQHEAEIKKRIGYAFGGVNFYLNSTLAQIACTTKSFFENWDDQAYANYMQEFALDESKKLKELSEGMKVKFNLVLALSHRAELLILDEPTSGLDPVSRDELLCLFKQLAEKGISILFSTHITSDLDKCAHHITYIKQGKIVASCAKADFVENFGGGTLEDIMLKIERGDY